jgi:hypothetical protein
LDRQGRQHGLSVSLNLIFENGPRCVTARGKEKAPVTKFDPTCPKFLPPGKDGTRHSPEDSTCRSSETAC